MSNLEQKLRTGSFVVTAELPVIDGGGYDEVLRQLEPMRAFVDAFNATDNPSAHAHCSPLAVAISLQRAAVEPVMQLTCRDRNRLALEADLIGAAMHGIENICCLTGDDVTAGDEPEARRVFDLDGPQLIAPVAGIYRTVRSSQRRTSSPARSRTPARRRSSIACAGRRRRHSRVPASYNCRSATARSCSSGSCTRHRQAA
jgi:hypothetical protein